MTLNILIIGDVVARPGRHAALERLQDLRETYNVDFLVLNGENTSGGYSITPQHAEELFKAGADVITSGNHIYDKKEVLPYIARQPRLLRPANYPEGSPGKGLWIGGATHKQSGEKFAVMNLIGRVFMPPNVDCPFRKVDELMASIPDDVKIRIVDFHAEATSEKQAFGWHLDGRATAVVGTHTHTQTADERVLPKGTAYITDLGMTGAYDGVIGMNANDVINRFMNMPAPRAGHAETSVKICGVLIEVDETTGKAVKIERLSLAHES